MIAPQHLLDTHSQGSGNTSRGADNALFQSSGAYVSGETASPFTPLTPFGYTDMDVDASALEEPGDLMTKAYRILFMLIKTLSKMTVAVNKMSLYDFTHAAYWLFNTQKSFLAAASKEDLLTTILSCVLLAGKAENAFYKIERIAKAATTHLKHIRGALRLPDGFAFPSREAICSREMDILVDLDFDLNRPFKPIAKLILLRDNDLISTSVFNNAISSLMSERYLFTDHGNQYEGVVVLLTHLLLTEPTERGATLVRDKRKQERKRAVALIKLPYVLYEHQVLALLSAFQVLEVGRNGEEALFSEMSSREVEARFARANSMLKEVVRLSMKNKRGRAASTGEAGALSAGGDGPHEEGEVVNEGVEDVQEYYSRIDTLVRNCLFASPDDYVVGARARQHMQLSEKQDAPLPLELMGGGGVSSPEDVTPFSSQPHALDSTQDDGSNIGLASSGGAPASSGGAPASSGNKDVDGINGYAKFCEQPRDSRSTLTFRSKAAVAEEEVNRFFSKYGPLLSMKALPPDTGSSSCMYYVSFKDRRDLGRARDDLRAKRKPSIEGEAIFDITDLGRGREGSRGRSRSREGSRGRDGRDLGRPPSNPIDGRGRETSRGREGTGDGRGRETSRGRSRGREDTGDDRGSKRARTDGEGGGQGDAYRGDKTDNNITFLIDDPIPIRDLERCLSQYGPVHRIDYIRPLRGAEGHRCYVGFFDSRDMNFALEALGAGKSSVILDRPVRYLELATATKLVEQTNRPRDKDDRGRDGRGRDDRDVGRPPPHPMQNNIVLESSTEVPMAAVIDYLSRFGPIHKANLNRWRPEGGFISFVDFNDCRDMRRALDDEGFSNAFPSLRMRVDKTGIMVPPPQTSRGREGTGDSRGRDGRDLGRPPSNPIDGRGQETSRGREGTGDDRGSKRARTDGEGGGQGDAYRGDKTDNNITFLIDPIPIRDLERCLSQYGPVHGIDYVRSLRRCFASFFDSRDMKIALEALGAGGRSSVILGRPVRCLELANSTKLVEQTNRPRDKDDRGRDDMAGGRKRPRVAVSLGQAVTLVVPQEQAQSRLDQPPQQQEQAQSRPDQPPQQQAQSRPDKQFLQEPSG